MKTLALLTTACTLFAALPSQAETEIESLRSQKLNDQRKIESLEQRLAKLEALIAKNPELKKQLAPAASASTAPVIISQGDTLFSIARKYGTTPEALMKANGITDPSSIPVGKILTIPGSKLTAAVANPPKAPAPAPKPAPKATPKPLKKGGTYTVQKGDTLYGISRRVGIPLAKLEAANPHVSPSSLLTGTVLKLTDVPVKKAAPPKPKKSQPKPAPKKEAKPAPKPKPKPAPKQKPKPKPAQKKQTKPAPATKAPPATKKEEALPQPKFEESADTIKSVRVTAETTYGQFAAKHGTTTSALNKLNGLKLVKGTLLAKGSELYVPGH